MSESKWVTINFRISAEEYGNLINALTPEMKQLTRSDLIRAAINAYVGECVFPLVRKESVWSRRS